MLFRAGSLSGLQAIEKFIRYTQNSDIVLHHLLYERLQKCPVEVIVLNPVDSNDFIDPRNYQVVLKFQQAWQICGESTIDSERYQIAYSNLYSIAEPQYLYSSTYSKDEILDIQASPLWRIRAQELQGTFILLSNKDETCGLPFFQLLQLSYLIQVEQNHLPLHASGVIHRNGLFLFTGPSDAGKSTAAVLSQQLGAELLDEDQILLRMESDGRFYGDGWGYQLKEGHAPIQAIFSLVQAQEDRLTRLPQVRAAHMLLERFFDVVHLQLSPELHAQVFSQIAELARSVPVYELHFRKSPDFWKLIEAEFPD